ncbi:MAG: glycine cleavage system aminomethyltransferase GcvT [Thermaceae bacterium]
MKRTPLYEVHLHLGGRMVEFAGYALPLYYTSIKEEHLRVRNAAGLFDVSHMGEFWIRGEGAKAFLQYVTLNDVDRLRVGRAQYSMLPNAQGGVVDDLYLYQTGEREYLMVVNAANRAKDWAHLQGLREGFEVEMEDASEETALLALQGPNALGILQGLVEGVGLSATRKNDTLPARILGKGVRLARTGYTGEDGFEIFLQGEDAPFVFQALLDRGAVPAGLGARDSLRLEAGFPLYGHELTDKTNPLCTPYAWVVKGEKDFFGKEALLSGECPRVLMGLVLEEGIPREGYRVLRDGREVGRVTSGGVSFLLGKGIALAYVDRGLEGPVEVEIRGALKPASLVKPPFVPLK